MGGTGLVPVCSERAVNSSFDCDYDMIWGRRGEGCSLTSEYPQSRIEALSSVHAVFSNVNRGVGWGGRERLTGNPICIM